MIKDYKKCSSRISSACFIPRKTGRFTLTAPLFFLIILAYGCGFQLNRNRIQLPDQATSLAISKIINHSYVPQLDLKLRELLFERFNRDSVKLSSAAGADLVLTISINSLSMSKSEYSLDDSVKTYDYNFSAKGTMSVYDNRNETYLISNKSLSGSYSIKTEATDLSASEIDEGREEALNSLGNQIAQNLNDDF